MDKIYVGNGKEITTKYGELLKVSFSKDDLDKMYQHLNEKGWINLNVNRRKEVGQYGHTHSIQVDTYDASDPKNQEQPQSAPQQTTVPQQSVPQSVPQEPYQPSDETRANHPFNDGSQPTVEQGVDDQDIPF